MMAGMPVIATETFENKKVITEWNGVLIHDDPQSFEDGLRKIISQKDNFNSNRIADSVREYSFEHIIDSKLKPLLFS
jgi:glycosyltransferase involved in cell wall biosynthesis